MTGLISVEWDKSKCMEVDGNDVVMKTCNHGNDAQYFRYVPGSQLLKNNGLCLDFHFIDHKFIMGPCHGNANQLVVYDEDSKQFQVTWNGQTYCFDFNYNTGSVYPFQCHENDNQKFFFRVRGGVL